MPCARKLLWALGLACPLELGRPLILAVARELLRTLVLPCLLGLP